MANDRTIISWDRVLNAKQKYEIKNMLIENYKAIYGSDIRVDAYSADAGWIDALTDILYDFSMVAINVYNSLDITNARGGLLDNLVLLSGNLIRKTPLKTRIQCILNINVDPIIIGTDVITAFDTENKMWIITPVDPNATEITSGDLVILEHDYEGEYLLPLGNNPLVEIRKAGSFVTNDNITLDSVIMIQRGAFAETDAQLKARKKESLSYNSTSLIDSIKEKALSTIFSIKDVKTYNSVGVVDLAIKVWNGSEAIDVTIPRHDIFVLIKPAEGVTIVQGGPNSLALVNVLKNKITLGISTFQDAGGTYFGKDPLDANYDANYHTVTLAIDSDFDEYEETYRYYLAQPYRPFIKINYVPLNNGFNLEQSRLRVLNAMYEYASDYGINKSINRAELMSIIYNAANIDPLNPTVRIDSIDINATKEALSGDNDVDVNNGYWYVDLIAELDATTDRRIFFATV